MNTRRLSLIALTAAAALGLAACGSSESGSDTTTSATSASSSQTSESSTTSDSATSDDTTSDDQAAGGSVTPTEIQAIVDAAAQEVDGTAYEIDDQDDDGTWEVDVASGSTSTEVTVSADGSEVLGTEEDDLDEDDRRGLDAATITVVEAIESAMAAAEGEFDDVELEAEGDAHVWKVSLDGPSGDDIEVHVDVTDGTVSVEKDTNDDKDDDTKDDKDDDN